MATAITIFFFIHIFILVIFLIVSCRSVVGFLCLHTFVVVCQNATCYYAAIAANDTIDNTGNTTRNISIVVIIIIIVVTIIIAMALIVNILIMYMHML
jgi:hypothetical protein